jgi:outer membrane cobalamin receptor
MNNRKVLATWIVLSLAGTGMVWAAGSESAIQEGTLDDYVVTADRVPTKRMETPADTTVITKAQLENNHYTSVGEALQHVNGVIVNETSAGSNAIVRINGDSRVAVLIDGQRLNNDQGTAYGRSSYDLSAFPTVKNIERIEVVKGAGSALYGSDAVGGVINIITRKGNKSETTLDANTGSWGTQHYSLTNEGSKGKTSWFFTAGQDKQNYFKYRQDGSNHKLTNSDYRDNSLTLRLDQKINDSSSLRFNFMHKTFEGKQHGALSWPNVDPAFDRLVNDWSGAYYFKENTNTPGYIRYYSNYMTTNQQSRFTTQTKGIDFQDSWQLNAMNRLTGGAEWRESKSSNEANGYTDKKITNKALYLEDIMKLNSKWTFTPGIRLDENSKFGYHKSPKAALNYKAGENTDFFASWGRVFSAPQADDLFYNVYFPAYYYGMYGNEDLKAETGYSETIGMNHKFDAKTSLSVSLFRSKINNAIRWYPDAMYNYYVGNLNEEKKTGIDVSFQKQVNDAWSYDLGYTYVSSKIDKGTGLQRDLGNSQPNGYRLGLHYAKNAWKANLMATAGSGRNTTVYSNHMYIVWDGNVSYDFNSHTTGYFKVNNLTNRQYESYSGYVLGDYPMPGRFYQVGVKYVF